MNSRIFSWMAWIFALSVLAGFFLPWLKFYSTLENRPQKLVRELTLDANRSWFATYFEMTDEEMNRAQHRSMEGIKGYDLPFLLNKGNSAARTALINSQLLGIKRITDRVYFVYAFPVSALFAIAFLTFSKKRWSFLLPFFACAISYGIVRYQLNVTYFDRLASHLDIGIGLWLSLYGLLGLAILLLLKFLFPSS